MPGFDIKAPNLIHVNRDASMIETPSRADSTPPSGGFPVSSARTRSRIRFTMQLWIAN